VFEYFGVLMSILICFVTFHHHLALAADLECKVTFDIG